MLRQNALPDSGGVGLQRMQAAGGSIKGLDSLEDMQKLMREIVGAAGPLAAALTTIAALTKNGFEGTVELEQFGRAVLSLSRELASAFAPVLDLATNLLNGFVGTLRDLGTLGQTITTRGFFGPWGYLIEVLNHPAVKQAGATLSAAFKQMMTAAQPLLTIFTNIATSLLKTFAVDPLVMFIDFLSAALLIMEELARAVMPLVQGILKFAGLQGSAQGTRRTEA